MCTTAVSVHQAANQNPPSVSIPYQSPMYRISIILPCIIALHTSTTRPMCMQHYADRHHQCWSDKRTLTRLHSIDKQVTTLYGILHSHSCDSMNRLHVLSHLAYAFTSVIIAFSDRCHRRASVSACACFLACTLELDQPLNTHQGCSCGHPTTAAMATASTAAHAVSEVCAPRYSSELPSSRCF